MLAAWLLCGNCAALVMVSARCEAPGQGRGQHLTLHGQGDGECATLSPIRNICLRADLAQHKYFPADLIPAFANAVLLD